MKNLQFEDLGFMRYKSCWDYQEELFKNIISQKLTKRDALTKEEKEVAPPPTSRLIFVEHHHVLTLGRSGDAENVVVSPARLAELGVDYFPTNRGGDITYHGPGQLVAYPILDLDQFFTDIHKYLRFLEEAVILTLNDFNINAGRVKGLTGVWVNVDNELPAKKICAMGVRCSRWVTMHGLALNVHPDLDYFGNIVPCGISDKAVTSMEMELKRNISVAEVSTRLKIHLKELFEFQYIDENT